MQSLQFACRPKFDVSDTSRYIIGPVHSCRIHKCYKQLPQVIVFAKSSSKSIGMQAKLQTHLADYREGFLRLHRVVQSKFKPKEPLHACPVCQEASADTQLLCKHKFCNRCLLQWLRAKLLEHERQTRNTKPAVVPCPICRSPHSAVTILGLV